MARVAGYGGQVNIGGAILGIREWSLDYVAAAIDSSGYDGGQPKTFMVGQTEFSGSFGGPKNQAPLALTIGAAVTFILYEVAADATRRWEGDGFITSVRPVSSVDGIVMYSYDFQGSGALAAVPTA